MDLPDTFSFEGWSIRYNLIQSSIASSTTPKPIVFVHGTPWSSAVFRPTIEALLSKISCQILTYDLPGYGQSQTYQPEPKSTTTPTSTPFAGDTSVKFQAEALAALLTHTNLSSTLPTVIAHDIAGTIVLRAHLMLKVEFSSMMLCDANAVLPWGDGFYKLARSDYQTFLKLPPKIFEAVVRAVTQSACYDINVLKAGWEDILAAPWIDDAVDVSQGEECGPRQRSYVRQIAQANDQDVREMLEGDLYGSVRCDVKVLWGEEDRWIPRKKVEELVQRMKGKVKETVYVPRAGHLVMLDQPARFAVEVFDWVGKNLGT